MAWPTPASYAGGLEKEEEWKRAEINDKGSVKREKSSLRQRKRVSEHREEATPRSPSQFQALFN